MSVAVEFAVVDPPDGSARAAALGRRLGGAAEAGELGGAALGRLDEVGAFLAACQGVSPPQPIVCARVVVFAAEHGVAARGISAYPAGATSELAAAVRAGTAPVAVLAATAGAGTRVVELDASAPIDVADALTDDEVHAAVRAGAAAADAEVDAGADLLVAVALGVGATTPACTLVAALTGTEPVAVVGRGSGIDDNGWMRKTAAVRDALRRARPHLADPLALLRVVGGADIAALAGFLAQAAVRRTPVLLDGLVVGAAAMLAEEFAPGARAWWMAAHRSLEPAHPLVLDHLDLRPLLELELGGDNGVGALAALPLVLMAARAHAELA